MRNICLLTGVLAVAALMACNQATTPETPAEKMERLNYALVEMSARAVLRKRSDPNWYAFGRAEYLEATDVTCFVLHTRSLVDHRKSDIHAVLDMQSKPDWHSKDDLSFASADWQRYCEKTKGTGKDYSLQLNQFYRATVEN